MRTPGVVSVGAMVTVPLSHLWVCAPVAGMVSVLTSPQTVQVNVRTPGVVSVGSVVTVPLSHLWPSAGLLLRFSVAPQPLQV